ncbi:MAG: hypothetical protein IJE05_03875 [Clostridia bacterium]|nr:hypothetical protein [Clostridia bacterium]
MKVLFAVSNEEISESIVKRYQKEYKEIISYKNVYYFNAILKELQKDKNYDRIVISEELEAFTNTQYNQIDKFIFDKLDSISDEASNLKGDDIPIILICSDRREKSEEMLVKMFGIGIYNALLGNDRSVDNVCNLLNKPRLKKDAKLYYRIDSDDVSYQSESENDVSEIEIQNILAHYKRLGKDEKRYVDSFDNIASQYNDVQLRVISKFLPLNVRAVLEEKSPKYQKIISYNRKVSNNLRAQNVKNEKPDKGTSEKLLNTSNNEKVLSKPVVIPSSVNMNGIKKMSKIKNQVKPIESVIEEKEEQKVEQIEEKEEQKIEPIVQEEPKRKRGRPRKNPIPEPSDVATPKRGRGRPKKNPTPEEQEKLSFPDLEEEETILPGFEVEEKDDVIFANIIDNNKENEEKTILPGFDDEEDEDDAILPGFEEDDEEETILPGFEDEDEEDEDEVILPEFGIESKERSLQNITQPYQDIDISNLLTSDKKIACFIGTSKNGTSFIVNNLAEITSGNGIDTAILDTTKNRNSYYIYTKNEENLRKTAMESINNLLDGTARGIQAGKNLTVYTSLPEETEGIENAGTILQTLLKKHSLVLIDCDFDTPIEYFEKAQEIYLVQTFDILTIQPLTAFLRELKSKNVLKESKLRVVLNKAFKIRGVNEKTIIGGMAYYNDPAMSFMTELFDKNIIKYITIPFNEEVYTKYLENIINCEVSVKGYPKNIIQILNELSNMVYPLVSGKSTYIPPKLESNGFTSSMNSTLNQMKNRY